MTIIFDATRKSTAPRSFGRGILAGCPVHRMPASLEDMEWAAQHLNEPAIDWEAEFERVTQQELIEAGYAPF